MLACASVAFVFVVVALVVVFMGNLLVKYMFKEKEPKQ